MFVAHLSSEWPREIQLAPFPYGKHMDHLTPRTFELCYISEIKLLFFHIKNLTPANDMKVLKFCCRSQFFLGSFFWRVQQLASLSRQTTTRVSFSLHIWCKIQQKTSPTASKWRVRRRRVDVSLQIRVSVRLLLRSPTPKSQPITINDHKSLLFRWAYRKRRSHVSRARGSFYHRS